MKNSKPSLLDNHQIIKRAFDDHTDAVRVSLADTHGMAVSLKAEEGDSVVAQSPSYSAKASLDVSMVDGSVVIPAFSSAGIKECNLYIIGASTPSLQVQINPSASDSIWLDWGSSLLTSASGYSVINVGDLKACQIRVVAKAAVSESATLYIVATG